MTSANVVGYNNIMLRAGSKMSGASFNMVAKQNMDLTELVPSGYENNSAYISGKTAKGIQGDIVVVILGSNGAIEKDDNGYDKTYAWYHSYATKTGWAAAGVWKQKQGSGYADMKAGDIIFEEGQGLWIQVPKNFNEGMKITCSGEALLDSKQIFLRAGSRGVIAPVSKEVDLTELVAKGYENNSAYISGKTAKGIQGDIVVVILGSNGAIEKDDNGYDKTYAWYHSYATKTGWAAAGVWKQKQGSGYADIKAGDVKFPMGTGLWVQVPKNFNEGMLIEFPGVDDAPAAE